MLIRRGEHQLTGPLVSEVKSGNQPPGLQRVLQLHQAQRGGCFHSYEF